MIGTMTMPVFMVMTIILAAMGKKCLLLIVFLDRKMFQNAFIRYSSVRRYSSGFLRCNRGLEVNSVRS